MTELLEDFDAYEKDVDRRIANARRGTLPDGAEAALLDVTICTDLELQIGSPNAEVRRCHDALEYLCGHLRDHVKKLRSAVYGDPDDDDNSNGADLAA